jgi:hypothetical protein
MKVSQFTPETVLDLLLQVDLPEITSPFSTKMCIERRPYTPNIPIIYDDGDDGHSGTDDTSGEDPDTPEEQEGTGGDSDDSEQDSDD